MTDSENKSAEPEVDGASISLYARLGGEATVARLVARFYDLMDELPQAQGIRAKHPADLSDTREKLFQYFTGWFGGPPLFIERYGHPRLRARHGHIEIGLEDRDAWLNCLHGALKELALDAELHRDLLEKIVPMADHMRNIEESEPLADC